jgi:hypothetical protein
LDQAEFYIDSFEAQLEANRSVVWRLPDAVVPDDSVRAAFATWRGLAIILATIDTIYWPPLLHRYRDVPTWLEVRQRFDPAATLSWLGVTVDEVTEHATILRGFAGWHDVLGDFHDLVRRADPQKWESLRGQARVAMDYHVTTELLESLADDAREPLPRPDPGPQVSRLERLTDRPRSLDAVLTDLHVSPHPSVVVGVEGATELKLVPRTAELLGVTVDPAWIQIEDFGGTKKDLSLLARYAARPLLGADRGKYVVLDRPPTRFLVLTDAENKYETAADRREQRALLIDSIVKEVPVDLRGDLVHRSSRLVEILTWGQRKPFEFAHFTDRQLADALLACSSWTHPKGRTGLIASIHAQRTKAREPSIDRAWRNSGVSKVVLADALWPILERRIQDAIARGTKGPPIMRATLRAHDLALHSPRWSMALVRRPVANRGKRTAT